MLAIRRVAAFNDEPYAHRWFCKAPPSADLFIAGPLMRQPGNLASDTEEDATTFGQKRVFGDHDGEIEPVAAEAEAGDE